MDNLKGKYVWTAKVGEKGQIVIPKEAREVFNIKSGDTLVLLGDEERGIAIIKSDDIIAKTILSSEIKREGDKK